MNWSHQFIRSFTQTSCLLQALDHTHAHTHKPNFVPVNFLRCIVCLRNLGQSLALQFFPMCGPHGAQMRKRLRCRRSQRSVCYLGVVQGSDALHLWRHSNGMEKGKRLSLFLRCASHACLAVTGFSEGRKAVIWLAFIAQRERKEEKVMTGLFCDLVSNLHSECMYRTVHTKSLKSMFCPPAWSTLL